MTAPQVWAVVVALVGGLVGAGWLGRLAWLRVWVRDFLARAELEIRHAVLEVEQTYVDRVLAGKDPSSPGGVELTPDEQAEALRRAVDRALELVGIAALDRALRILGLPRTPAFIAGWIATRVEARVKLLSLEGEFLSMEGKP